jgi:pilus assembly protein CpaF
MFSESLCRSTHAEIVAGTCPWCGGQVLNGQVVAGSGQRVVGSETLRPNLEDLLCWKALTPEMAMLLEAAVRSALNVLISGKAGSGKTALLNILGAFIPYDDCVVTVTEDGAATVSRRDRKEPLGKGLFELGVGAVTFGPLRAARLLLDECPEDILRHAVPMIAVGSPAVLMSLRASDPDGALGQLAAMVQASGDFPPGTGPRQELAASLHLVAHTECLPGDLRKVTRLAEVEVRDGAIALRDLFTYEQLGLDSKGRTHGLFRATGVRSSFLDRFASAGIRLPSNLFVERVLLKD